MWVWQDDPKDTAICKAKQEMIKNIISFLESDVSNTGEYSLEIFNIIKLIKIMFDASKFLTFTAPVDAMGKTVTEINPINITITAK